MPFTSRFRGQALRFSLGLYAIVLLSHCTTPSSSLAERPAETTNDAGSTDASNDASPDTGAPTMDGSFPDVGNQDSSKDVEIPQVLEPDGPPELRLLHAVSDYPYIRFCLVPWVQNQAGKSPLPSLSTLTFGEHQLVTWPADVDLEHTDYRVFVMSGPDVFGSGLSCDTWLNDPPPGNRVQALPVLPAGTLTEPRSLLLIAQGCLGGSVALDPVFACGGSIDSEAGNLSMTLVEMSRIPPKNTFGIQVVHAMAALEPVRVRGVSAVTGSSVYLASTVGLGSIRPSPPWQADIAEVLGPVPTKGTIQITTVQSNTMVKEFEVGTSLLASGFTDQDLTNNRAFVLVLAGSKPGSPNGMELDNPARLLWIPSPTLPNTP
jgi:hypothetical protein